MADQMDFRQLLVYVAAWYDKHELVDMLKVVYMGHVQNKAELQRATHTMEIQNLLVGSGLLSPENRTLIYDAVKITGQGGLWTEIKVEAPLCSEDTGFTDHRQRLINLGFSLEESDIKTIKGSYNISPKKKYKDNWSLILDLEKKHIINNEENLTKFRDKLALHGCKNAVEALAPPKQGGHDVSDSGPPGTSKVKTAPPKQGGHDVSDSGPPGTSKVKTEPGGGPGTSKVKTAPPKQGGHDVPDSVPGKSNVKTDDKTGDTGADDEKGDTGAGRPF